MIELKYINGIISFRNIDYQFEKVEKIDDMCVHIFMGDQIIAFIGGETSINGTVMTDADHFINTLA